MQDSWPLKPKRGVSEIRGTFLIIRKSYYLGSNIGVPYFRKVQRRENVKYGMRIKKIYIWDQEKIYLGSKIICLGSRNNLFCSSDGEGG